MKVKELLNDYIGEFHVFYPNFPMMCADGQYRMGYVKSKLWKSQQRERYADVEIVSMTTIMDYVEQMPVLSMMVQENKEDDEG